MGIVNFQLLFLDTSVGCLSARSHMHAQIKTVDGVVWVNCCFSLL